MQWMQGVIYLHNTASTCNKPTAYHCHFLFKTILYPSPLGTSSQVCLLLELVPILDMFTVLYCVTEYGLSVPVRYSEHVRLHFKALPLCPSVLILLYTFSTSTCSACGCQCHRRIEDIYLSFRTSSCNAVSLVREEPFNIACIVYLTQQSNYTG